jgi:hypothetical protein
MSDRRDLQEELNRINKLYQEKDLELRKAGGSDLQRQQMRDMLNRKKAQLTEEMGDDLQKLNVGKSINVGKAGLFKKIAGIIPLAGAGMAAMSGDPAMAAEELAADLPGGEALRSEAAGMSPEEEAMMLAEIDAQKAYAKSPARMDRLRALMGKK